MRSPLTPPSTTSLQQLNLGHGPSPSSLTATMQEAALPSTSETNVHLNLGEKTTVKKAKSRVFLTNTEKYLQDKLVAASIKLSKMKKLSVNVKAAKQIASNPAQTLIKLVQICNIKPGINSNIFSQLKNKADNMKIEQRLCVVMFDEVSLKSNVAYNERKDKITSLVDNGQNRKTEFADHAQVFMLRGLIYNYKQAISYTFASSATKGPERAQQIKDVIRGLQESGFIVVATVCDQGPNNRQALKLLINENRGIYLRKGKNILPAECKDTADLLLFMDNIFDSVNGSRQKNRNAKPLLGPATPNSAHHQIWIEGVQIFKSMKFVSNGKKQSVPSITNWVWTLSRINKLQNEFNVSSVWLRHLNQDPLENFFGAVRSQGCRNTNPTCDQFESAFTTLLINNISSVHTRGNCEKDFCDALYSLTINENAETTSTCSSFDFSNIIEFNFTPIEIKERDPRIVGPLQYISGYFLKKIKSKIFKTCTDCCNLLMEKNEIEYIKYREYAGRRWLCTPSKKLIELISNMQDLIKQKKI
ncbi:hypothetical protein HW555_010691 [Spodoptera exigua]|uniref:Transposable element P transposase n=1 Tax=Spodoptera exigua TaxID=7107 RepID=A0A835L0P8_SPOEX|nr:hypothetical protein HW555_010691 [Spodoptera exigua]